MKNRYLLLLITLIFGLTTEVAQASDNFKKLKELASLPVVYKAIENALPKDHTIAKSASALYAPPARLTRDKQMRENTYQTVRNYLTQYNIKPEYANWHLKTAENLMLAEGQKYDFDFRFRFISWRLGDQWATSYLKKDKAVEYQMPTSCIGEIIRDRSLLLRSLDKLAFQHERGHDYLNHLPAKIALIDKMIQRDNFAPFYRAKTKEEFLQISNKEDLLNDLISLHHFCVKQEKEANAFVPNDPTLLAAGVKLSTFYAHNTTTFDPEHPPYEQQAEDFKNRFKIVTKLQTEEELDRSIASYANDFDTPIKYSDNDDHTSLDFSDEYSVYLALKPIVLGNVQFYE